MEPVIRATIVYIVLLIIFRIAGKRSLSQITTFDLVLVLIISEVVQQAMVANDSSMLNAFLLVITLVGLNILISVIKQHSPAFSKLIDSVPVVLIENGKVHKDRMDRERVDEDDILESARELQGIERMDQIKYAVLERSGHVTVVPKES